MKSFLVVFVLMCITGLSLNAQVPAGNSGFEFRGGKFYQNGTELSPEQLSYIIGKDTYDNQYTPAKRLRTAGVVCLSAGSGVAAIGTGILVFGVTEANSGIDGSIIGGMVAVGVGGITALVGVATAITGGCLMGSANKKMKKIRPTSNGVGLALAF